MPCINQARQSRKRPRGHELAGACLMTGLVFSRVGCGCTVDSRVAAFLPTSQSQHRGFLFEQKISPGPSLVIPHHGRPCLRHRRCIVPSRHISTPRTVVGEVRKFQPVQSRHASFSLHVSFCLQKQTSNRSGQSSSDPNTLFIRLYRRFQKADIGLVPTFFFLLRAAIIGLFTGLSIISFKLAISVMESYTYGGFLTTALNAFGTGQTLSFAMALIPPMGGLMVALIREFAQDFPPGLNGQIDDVDKGRTLDFRKSLLKSFAAVATLGTGNSLGPEGPSVELGAVVSRVVSNPLSTEQKKQLLTAGSAAGVAAGFNAPIAGVFFALEIASGSGQGGGAGLQKSTLAGILLSAVIAALIARVGLQEDLALRPAPYALTNPLIELPAYLGLGLLSGLVALTFRYLLTVMDDFFKGKSRNGKPGFMAKVPRFLKPIIGGAVCGLTGIVFPQVLFFGYETLDGVIANQSFAAPLLLALLGLKTFVTSVCMGSGLVGGLFAPSLFLGATTGAAFQKFLVVFIKMFIPFAPVAGAPAYAMVGAASVLASMFRAPLTGSLLLFELTRDWDIFLPLTASAGVASLLIELVERKRKLDEASALDEDPALKSSMSARNTAEDSGMSAMPQAALLAGTAAGLTPDLVKKVVMEEADDERQAMEVLGSLLVDHQGRGTINRDTLEASTSIGVGGTARSEKLLYGLRVKESMVSNPLILPPLTSLEEALLRLCAAKSDYIIVMSPDGGPLVGVSSLPELMMALQRWYERQSGQNKKRRTEFRGKGSRLSNSKIRTEEAAAQPQHEAMQAALAQVLATQDAAERALALEEILRQLHWSTGLTLREVCDPVRQVITGNDKVIVARDLLLTQGLTVVPVFSSKNDAEATVLGLVDLASIRAAVFRQQTVEMVSRSVVELGPKRREKEATE